MKRLIISIFAIFVVLPIFSQGTNISYTDNNGFIIINFKLTNYSIGEIETQNGTFSKIHIDNTIPLEKKGWPEVPFTSITSEINNNAKIEVSDVVFHEIRLNYPLIPSRGTIYRNQNPDSLPYIFLPEANINDFYPSQIAVAEPFQFRETKKANIRIFPFQYNPAQKTLRIYDKISIKIANTKMERDITALSNYDYGDILVITPEKYDSAILPYITWKREMGYNVSVINCDSAENVTSKIAEAYNRNPNLLFVQLVGDWNDVQSTAFETGSNQPSPTDPLLGCVAGGDAYPDLAIGRFSCSSADELAIQLQKCITYEKSPNNNRDWREKFIGIGSGEGPGDDNELDYEHVSKIFNSKLSNFTYNVHSEHYANGTNVSSNALATSINLGASSIAYCGHGSGSYWLTGSYSGANVTSSSNGDKLPFVISVACLNGAFQEADDCFAEKWMKAPHGGAVATLMSSISQPWEPPMRGQDYFFDILSDGYDYDADSTCNGLNTNEQRTRWGSIVLNTFYLMLCESAQASDIETILTWISFGDASLQLRTKTPQKITSSNRIITEGENFKTTITANGNVVKNALVCISQNGHYYKGFTNSRGKVSLEQHLEAGKALLVVTAFNGTTIYDSIPVIANDKPYIAIDSYSPHSINFGERSKISMVLKNFGNVPADSIPVKIFSSDSYLSIIADSTFLDVIDSCGIAEINDFEIAVSPETPFGHIFNILAQIEYNDSIHELPFEVALTGQDCYSPDEFYVTFENDTCSISWDNTTIKNFTIFDSFDNYDDHPTFEINSSGKCRWQYVDLDDSQTMGISGYSFANNHEKMAFIIMNPKLAYSDTSDFESIIRPHSGDQFLASFRSTTGQTNDWIFSPELNFAEDFEFSFYVRGSHKPSYWETMEVYYSTDNYSERIDSCTIKGSADPNNWTFKSYTIPDSAKYVAIRNISNNKYFLCIDDIMISGNAIYNTDVVDIYNNDSLIATNVSDSVFIAADLAEGEYCFKVIPSCNRNLICDTAICISVIYECEAPSNVECYRTNELDSLIWTTSPQATSYNIYSGDSLIANTTDTSFVCTNTNRNYSVSSICRHNESEITDAEITIINIAGNTDCGFSIFPNPTDGSFTIDAKSSLNLMKYTINDICGKMILQGELKSGLNAISLQDMPDGIYIISISANDSTHKLKIIKQ